MTLKSLGRAFESDHEEGVEAAVRAASGDTAMAQQWLHHRQEA